MTRTVYDPLGAALLDDLDRLCAEAWKPTPDPFRLPCERCGRPYEHAITVGGEPAPLGWRYLCCEDADLLMALAAEAADDPDDAIAGLRSFVATHRVDCGPRWLRDLRGAA